MQTNFRVLSRAFRWLCLPSLILSCQSGRIVSHPTTEPASPIATANLTEAEAALRFTQVRDVSYRLDLDLTASESFVANETIDFLWTGAAEPLRLDFAEGKIKELKINDRVAPIEYNGQFLLFPSTQFKSGENRIQILYSRSYASNGRGLLRFTDPEDNRVYLHSKFEPYYANRMFPCFDQPDLKATYTLAVLAPRDWTVIAPTYEEKKEARPGNLLRWSFPTSARFSTYLFSLHAGPFKMWKGTAGDIPLRLFARRAMAKYVDAKEWLLITQQGLAFYNRYTGFPYPFRKYDQIIAPAFNAGAMENVAAVTFSERLVPRGKKLRSDRRILAGIILHEMAHMWFGDLVTMKWWNDLWLNESFATFASLLASAQATEFTEAWALFHGERSDTILLDQLVTTHPIESRVADIKAAVSTFDGITYGKGAAVLEQLHYYLGPDAFRTGVQQYFEKYAWKNTRRSDFVQSLAEASGKDLSSWQTLWLTTANVNSIHVVGKCDAGKLTRLDIEQSANEGFPTLRPHALELAFLNANEEPPKVTATLRAEINSERNTVPAANGLACPSIVYPNYNGHGYFKILFDGPVAASLLKCAPRIQPVDLQILVWSSLWQSVQDSRLSFIRFGEAAAEAIKEERNEDILESLFSRLSGIIDLYYKGELQKTDVFARFVKRVEELTWARFQSAPEHLKTFWFVPVVSFSESPERQRLLASILDGRANMPDFIPDADLRWDIIKKLSGQGFPGARDLINKERARDPSFNAKIGAITSEAALPTWQEKAKWIDEYVRAKPSYSYFELRAVVKALFPSRQQALRKQYEQRFFTDLLDISARKDSSEQSTFATLAPYSCESDSLARANDFIGKHPELDPNVVKELREAADKSVRCRNVVDAAGENRRR